MEAPASIGLAVVGVSLRNIRPFLSVLPFLATVNPMGVGAEGEIMRLDLFKRFPFGWSININIVGPQQPKPELRWLTQEEANQFLVPLTCPSCDTLFAVNEDGIYCPNCGMYPVIQESDPLTLFTETGE